MLLFFMSDFLFHKVSEKEKEEIRKQAKGIIENFSKQLDKVKGKVEESFNEIGDGQRDEGKNKCNEFDRKIFFENAPEKNGDFVVGEVKKW
jgi:Asp-tRNA(Asn)/Glu-tRNA(Gln) amidotransferase C subunit